MKNLNQYKSYIFDVGANDGVDGLAIAIKNKDYFIHAFEPNPSLVTKIKYLKKLIEKRKGLKILNYKINNFAIGNENKVKNFYISNSDQVSSLNKLSKNLVKKWPGLEDGFKIVKKIKVKVITLKTFCNRNKIQEIRYLHIDTQGNDLKVLKGLSSKINIVQEGKIEAAINKKKAAYQNNHTIADVKKFFSINNLKILKIIENKHLSGKKIIKNEVDIFYKNKNFKKLKKIKLNYNLRYFNRLLKNKTNWKDDFFDFIEKKKNLILN